jgi:PIN domain nuclease of toxin-antitoxin system
MRLLSDTHTFIWSFSNTKKLSPTAARELQNPANEIFVSVASVWEMEIKIKLGKFSFSDTLENVIAEERRIKNLLKFLLRT